MTSSNRRVSLLATFASVAFCYAGITSTANGQLEGTVSVDITQNPDGRFQYDYLIENFATSQLSINAFLLTVGPDADVQDLQNPQGWFGEYVASEPNLQVGFISGAEEFDIPIGGIGEFSITSSLAPGLHDLFVANFTPDFTEVNGSILGFIESPAFVIPEPASAGSMLIAAMCACAMIANLGSRLRH